MKSIRQLYDLGKLKHEFGFRGMIVAVLLIGFLPGGLAVFAYEGIKERSVIWIITPLVCAFVIACLYSVWIILSARKSEKDLKEFQLRLMGIDHLADRIFEQAKWNPEARSAWDRYCSKGIKNHGAQPAATDNAV